MLATGEADGRPILIVPYMWIGDFVRCHTVVRLLRARFPHGPVDVLTTAMVAPLLDYMPGVRKGVVAELPRKRLALRQHRALAARLRAERYGRALIMPRTWKSALAPFLAGIPQRTGFVGEMRFGLINDLRRGERALPRMVDRCAALALPGDAGLPADYPLPQLHVAPNEIGAWRQRLGLGIARPIAAFAPGAVGPSKRWPAPSYAEAARRLADRGFSIWILGGPGERALAEEIRAGSDAVRDLTGPDLRNAIVALAAADVAVSNDSGLLHVAAALGTPSIGIFGPTSPWHWRPLNPVSAILEPETEPEARQRARTIGNDAVAHHRTADVSVERVLAAVRAALAGRR